MHFAKFLVNAQLQMYGCGNKMT